MNGMWLQDWNGAGGAPFHTFERGALAFQGAGLDAASPQSSQRTLTSVRDSRGRPILPGFDSREG
jgi:hypothetical protein